MKPYTYISDEGPIVHLDSFCEVFWEYHHSIDKVVEHGGTYQYYHDIIPHEDLSPRLRRALMDNVCPD